MPNAKTTDATTAAYHRINGRPRSLATVHLTRWRRHGAATATTWLSDRRPNLPPDSDRHCTLRARRRRDHQTTSPVDSPDGWSALSGTAERRAIAPLEGGLREQQS